jgi:antitoxin component of MazEF toxin-antitoxin module
MKIELEKKIVKIGRSKGIIIPPLFLKVLGIDNDNNTVKLTVEEDGIVIRKKD